MNRVTFRLVVISAAIIFIGNFCVTARADSIVHFSYDGVVSGGYDVQIFTGTTPLTARNFLSYVNNNAYDSSIIHRYDVPNVGSVLSMEGGGFTLGDPNNQQVYPTPAPLHETPSQPIVDNETGMSNVRGTLAMLSSTGETHSVASQWSINLADNSASRDGQNTGYIAFGIILGDGMMFLDGISNSNPNISTYDLSGSDYYNNPALSDVPLFATITETDFYLSFIKIASAAVTPAPWNGGPIISGDWGEKANWGGVYNNVCVPDGPGSKISLDNQTTTVNTLDMATVGRTVGSFKFTGDSTLISSSGGYNLTLDNIDRPAVIDVTGNHTISAPVVLASDARIFGAGVLNLTAGISGDYTLSVESGTLNASSIQVDSLSIGNSGQVVAVPEPSTSILLSLALAGLFFASRRGRR